MSSEFVQNSCRPPTGVFDYFLRVFKFLDPALICTTSKTIGFRLNSCHSWPGCRGFIILNVQGIVIHDFRSLRHRKWMQLILRDLKKIPCKTFVLTWWWVKEKHVKRCRVTDSGQNYANNNTKINLLIIIPKNNNINLKKKKMNKSTSLGSN